LPVVRNGGELGCFEKLFFRCNPHRPLRTLIANQRLSLLVSLVPQGSCLALINARTALEPGVRRRDIDWGFFPIERKHQVMGRGLAENLPSARVVSRIRHLSKLRSTKSQKIGGVMFEGLFQPMHLLIIAGIALLIFGPKRLPELGKGLGEGLRGFKAAMNPDAGKPEGAQNNQ